MLAVNTECWVPDEYHGFIEAITVEEFAPGQPGKVKLIKTQTEVVLPTNVSKRMERRETTAAAAPLDLSNLPHLSKASILQATRVHHASQQVYSSVGPILISTNPYQRLAELYSEDKQQEYFDASTTTNATLPPHLYQIAARAFRGATGEERKNQSIVFSGESGGGKTMASRLLTEFLVYCSSQQQLDQTFNDAAAEHQIKIQNMLVNAVPLIESFGNARTERNDNSSRFGCWTVIEFDYNAVAGAKLRSFNLEKSRVVSRGEEDDKQRNFHIFYQYLAGGGGSSESKEYRYLQGTKTTPQDAVNFATTKQIMLDLNMDCDSMLKVLRGILELGNVDFVEQEDKAAVENMDQVAIASESLGFASPADLAACLIQRDISNAKEVIFTTYTKQQAEESRDALAKHLYGRLFDWVLNSINLAMRNENCTEPDQGFVGMLDMYGFEIFATNSLEQLCINYCNERIMESFNKKYIYEEAEFYRAEGITTSFNTLKRDRTVLDLLECNPQGILNLLDEECKIPKGSDAGLLKRLRKVLTSNPKFIPHVPQQENLFAIAHFASTVKYNVQGFLDKNRDTLPLQVEELCQNASGLVGAELFASTAAAAVLTRQRSTLAAQKISLASRFRNELRELMDTVESTDTHFVRCIKPNSTDSPVDFHGSMVLAQLSYSGVLETCKLRQEHGYELRQTHDEFVCRQARFFPSSTVFDVNTLVQEINQTLGTNILVGKTFVFVNTVDLQALDARGTTVHTKCVLVMQAFARMAVEKAKHAKRKSFMGKLHAELAMKQPRFLVLDGMVNGPEVKRLFPNNNTTLPLIVRARQVCVNLETAWEQTLSDVERAIAEKDMVKLQLWLDSDPMAFGDEQSPHNARLAAIVTKAKQALLDLARNNSATKIQRWFRLVQFRSRVKQCFAELAKLDHNSKPEEISPVIQRMNKLGLGKHPEVLRVKQYVPTTLQRPKKPSATTTVAGARDTESIDVYKIHGGLDLGDLKMAVGLARQKLQRQQVTVQDARELRRAIEAARKLGAQGFQLEEALLVEVDMYRVIAGKKLTWWQRLVSCGGCMPNSSTAAYAMPTSSNPTRPFD